MTASLFQHNKVDIFEQDPARRCPGTAPNISGSRDAGATHGTRFLPPSKRRREGGGGPRPYSSLFPSLLSKRTTVAFLDGQMGNGSSRAFSSRASNNTGAPQNVVGILQMGKNAE